MKNKRIWIISGIGVLLIAGIITAVILIKPDKVKKDKDKAEPFDSSASSVAIEEPEKDNKTDDTEEQVSDDGTALTIPEPEITVPDNRTGERAGQTTKAKQPVKEEAPAVAPTEKTYVQDANPDTGISWDGKSAIVYRLASGETTTEKQYGGYYEIRPSIWKLLERPMEREEENNKCSICGKVMGDGTDGTCVRWMMGDQICPHCGKEVPGNTCHTCHEEG